MITRLSEERERPDIRDKFPLITSSPIPGTVGNCRERFPILHAALETASDGLGF